MKISLPLSPYWYHVVTPPLSNNRRKKYGTSTDQSFLCIGKSEHKDCGSLRPPYAAVKYHHGPNPNFTFLPIDFYLSVHFMGRDNCRHRSAQYEFPTQTYPNPRLTNLRAPLLTTPYTPLPPPLCVPPQAHHWRIDVYQPCGDPKPSLKSVYIYQRITIAELLVIKNNVFCLFLEYFLHFEV